MAKRKLTHQEILEHLGLENESHDNIRKMGLGGLLKGVMGALPVIGDAVNVASGVSGLIQGNKPQQQVQQPQLDPSQQNFQQAQQPVKLDKGGRINYDLSNSDNDPNDSDDLGMERNTLETTMKDHNLGNPDYNHGIGEEINTGMLGNFKPKRTNPNVNDLLKQIELEKKMKEGDKATYNNAFGQTQNYQNMENDPIKKQAMLDRLEQAEAKSRQKYSDDTNKMSSLGMRGTSLQELKRPELTIDKPEDTDYEYWNDKGRTFRLKKGDDEKNMEISKDGNKFFKVQSWKGGWMNIGSHGEDSRPKDKTEIPDETKPVISHTDDNGEIIGYKSSADSKVVYRHNPISGKIEVLSKKGNPLKEGGSREAIRLRKERGAIDESKEGELESIGIPVYKKK